MAGKTVSFNASCDLFESQLETLAKWLSCNGEIWGIGPTGVFASAAALFLYRQLESTIFVAGDHLHVTILEKTLVSTMVLGMLALMIHLWVCSTRFFQYYLDTLIRDSPSVLLEMTTAGLLGAESELVPLGPLTRFLKQQQPQIHITICWFLSLCYADYVRKNYCQRFNLPYLEQCETAMPASDAIEKISWGCRRSDSALAQGNAKDVCMRFVGQSADTTAEAVERLRTLITATRCSCCSPAVPGVSNASNTEDTDDKQGEKRLAERQPSTVTLRVKPPAVQNQT